MDVDLGLVGQQLGDAGGVVGQVGHLVIVGVATERLEQDPEEVGEDAVGAGALCVPNVVVHVGHTAGEGKHDDEEGDEEHDLKQNLFLFRPTTFQNLRCLSAWLSWRG